MFENVNLLNFEDFLNFLLDNVFTKIMNTGSKEPHVEIQTFVGANSTFRSSKPKTLPVFFSQSFTHFKRNTFYIKLIKL